MSTIFSAVKKVLFSLFREFIAVKSDFISFSRYFIAMRTVVIPYEDGRHSNEDGREGDEDGRHGDKAPKNSLRYLERRPFCFQIFDSPGVKVYHFAGVSGFRRSNCPFIEMGCAPRFSYCQKGKLKP
ncbi:hypothetical protein [Parabacteroides sp. AF48-14]|uniref:hypothetical protein n=1 Tax=Parabacteroides sp. AF48-14 TaxID=2292052 RepID=UPI0011C432A2|nr:hypothetical protein [Parabacteroides sp. AF48-14]